MAKTALKKRIVASVPITLKLEDGAGGEMSRSFNLAFDFNAISRVETMTGLGVLNAEIWKKPSATNISILFWAAVCVNHPEYDYDPATDESEARAEGLVVLRSYMDAGNVTLITKKLSEAFIASLPADQRERAAERQAAAERGEANPTKPAPTEISKAPDESSNG